MSGRGIIEAEVWRSEQLEARERTSDPSNPAVGDVWVRVDINPTVDNSQTLAELRIQGQGGVLKVPLIDIQNQPSLGPDVYVGPRFFLDEYVDNGLSGVGEIGFVPVTDQGGAKGSPRVVTPAGVEYEAHDAVELSAIPDSAVRQWPFNQRTTTGTDVVDENLANDKGDTNGNPTNTADSQFYKGYYEAFDGVTDGILLPNTEFVNQIQSKDFGFALTTRMYGSNSTPDDSEHIFGSLASINSTASDRFQLFYSTKISSFKLFIYESNNNNEVTIDPTISDGSLKRLFFRVPNVDDVTTWQLYINDDGDVNGSGGNLSVGNNSSNFDGSNIDLNDERVGIGCREFDGSVQNNLKGDIDVPILYDSPTRQDVSNDYNLQPWV